LYPERIVGKLTLGFLQSSEELCVHRDHGAFLLVGCNDHANFGRLHETMTAKLRSSLDFDVSLFFISKIWRVDGRQIQKDRCNV